MKTPGRRKPNPFKWIRLRVLLVASVLGICLALMIGRAFQLHVLEGKWLQTRAAGQYKKELEDRAKRGTIYDRNLAEMAVSVDLGSICAHPRQISSPEQTASALSKVLKLRPGPLLEKLRSKKNFVWVKRQADPEQVSAVKALGLEGVGFRTEGRRFYPLKSVAAQIIGFSGTDETGLGGLEFHYNDLLKGPEETQTVLRDALGRDFITPATASEGKAGLNLILTIDKNIQCIAEEALAEGVKAFSAESGIALVMVPRTGEVLAMAHFPRFNPNAYGHYQRGLWRNRAITDSFEPGSSFKVFLVAAALESGRCTPTSEFYCEKGAYRIGRNVIHDVHPHGTLSLEDILKYSSNIGAAKVGETIGFHYFYEKLQDFGFGEKLGVDSPAETAGRLLPVKNWTNIDAVAICFGQGVAVSALQLGAAVSAIANDGGLMKPYVVQRITDSRGRLVEESRPILLRQVISPENARQLKRMMERTVEKGGTGVRAAVPGYTVAGKTGTAQKVNPSGGGYAKDKYIAVFVGFVPVKRPEIVTLVLIDEPQKNHYGGVVAAPVFRRIVEEAVRYLKIPPEPAAPVLTDMAPDDPEQKGSEVVEEAVGIS